MRFHTLEYQEVVEKIVFLRPMTSEIQVHYHHCYHHLSHHHHVAKKSYFHFYTSPEKCMIFNVKYIL